MCILYFSVVGMKNQNLQTFRHPPLRITNPTVKNLPLCSSTRRLHTFGAVKAQVRFATKYSDSDITRQGSEASVPDRSGSLLWKKKKKDILLMGRGVQVVNHWKTTPPSCQEEPFSSLPPAQSVRNMPQRQGSNLEGSLRQKMFHQARSKTTLGSERNWNPSSFGSTMSLLAHPQSDTSVLETTNDSINILKCSKGSVQILLD